MLRTSALTLLLLASLNILHAADVDPVAMESLKAGNSALERADGDPSQNLVAALAFAKALPAYEAAGDQETAAELKSVIFWCKKRMDIGALQRFVASKGEEGEVLTAAVAKVEQPVAASEAKDYLAKAEAYAQKNSGQHLKIAIRYFEVADRFQGTQESLRAQRLSLEALQQSMVSRRAADPAMAAELRSEPIVAGDLPESAQKLIEPSNKAVDEVAAKAAQAVAQDRRKATDAVLKEAEAAQRKGDLKLMIAHQNQAKDIDRDVPGLSKAAAAAIETYRKARTKIVTKALGDVIDERKKLIQALERTQKEETKKGNTGGALAIQGVIGSLGKEINESSAKVKPAVKPVALRDRIAGSYYYDFRNGNKGTLKITKSGASLAGFSGSLVTDGEDVIIEWNNNTKWTLRDQAGEISVNASDGSCLLIPESRFSSKEVVFYTLPNFQGDPTIVRTFGTVVDAYTIGFPNDALRSIKVPVGVKVTVYEGNLGGGQSIEIIHDVAELKGGPALGMTSFRLEKRAE